MGPFHSLFASISPKNRPGVTFPAAAIVARTTSLTSSTPFRVGSTSFPSFCSNLGHTVSASRANNVRQLHSLVLRESGGLVGGVTTGRLVSAAGGGGRHGSCFGNEAGRLVSGVAGRSEIAGAAAVHAAMPPIGDPASRRAAVLDLVRGQVKEHKDAFYVVDLQGEQHCGTRLDVSRRATRCPPVWRDGVQQLRPPAPFPRNVRCASTVSHL